MSRICYSVQAAFRDEQEVGAGAGRVGRRPGLRPDVAGVQGQQGPQQVLRLRFLHCRKRGESTQR